jgi:hypothetical protein
MILECLSYICPPMPTSMAVSMRWLCLSRRQTKLVSSQPLAFLLVPGRMPDRRLMGDRVMLPAVAKSVCLSTVRRVLHSSYHWNG